MLTERQVGILKKEKLPADETQLSARQKKAIAAIEEILSYLAERYGEKFVYKGYWPAGSGQAEHLAAESSRGTLVVYRTAEDGKYIYSDNYTCLSAAPAYEETIKQALSGLIPYECTVRFTAEKADESDGDELLSRITARGVIGIENAHMTAAELKSTAEIYGDRLAPRLHGKTHIVSFYSLQPKTDEWYIDMNLTERLKSAAAGPVICVIDDQGTVRVY